MSGLRYSVYAVEKNGKFLRSASYSRAAERAAKMGGKVAKITIQHPGACRDTGDLINTRVISAEPA